LFKRKNSKNIRKFIRENSSLFWYIKDDSKEYISEEYLIETILNWGDLKSIRKLFKLLGIKKVANIFYDHVNRKRHNYLKLTEHFFRLYFDHNVRKTSKSKK